MAYLCIIVSLPAESIAQLNPQASFPTKVHVGLQAAENIIQALKGGEKRSDNCYVVVRDTDPSVATSGSGSTSTSYNKP